MPVLVWTYADAISASDANKAIVPIQHMMKLYTNPAGPPFVNPSEKTLSLLSNSLNGT